MEIKKLTPKQQKAAWIIGAILLVIHFLPSFIATMQQAFSHHTTRAVATVAPQPVATPRIVATPTVPIDPFAAQYVGFFQGQQLTPQMENCSTSLEVRPAVAKPGFYSGYATMACAPSPLFYKGPMTAQMQGKLPGIIASSFPVSVSMTGSITDGDMAFRVDKVMGATPEHCGPSSFALSSFGTGQLMSQWQPAPPCKGGEAHMVLVKKRA